MPTVQIAHPTAELEDVDEELVDEWISYPGMKLLAIPFETEVLNLANHNRIRGKIFAAVHEITSSDEVSVSAPKPSQDATLRQRAPISFLLYDLTPPTIPTFIGSRCLVLHLDHLQSHPTRPR
jgi:hypothetical protein